MKTWTKIALAAGAIVAGAALFAQMPGDPMRMAQELNLTQQQQDQLRQLRFEQARKMIDLRRNVELQQLALREEMAKDNPDPAKVDKTIDNLALAKAQVAKLRFSHMQQVRKILTPEQWQRARQLFRERMMERRAHRMGRGRKAWHQGTGQGMGWPSAPAPDGYGQGPNAPPPQGQPAP
jgi:Spy/CpxP family protein refolding chaperone